MKASPSDPRDPAIKLMRTATGEYAAGLSDVRKGKLPVLVHEVKFLKKLDLALEGLGITGREVACKKGCSYCCHYHVYISAEEALALAQFARDSLSEEARARVVSNLRENAGKVAQMTLQEHMVTNLACAFLAADGSCMAYESRPLACRKHHSYTIEGCEETFENPRSGRLNEMSQDREKIGAGFMMLSAIVCRDAGVDFARYEMSGAVLEAMENPSAEKRWKAGKKAFPSVRDRDDSGGIDESM